MCPLYWENESLPLNTCPKSPSFISKGLINCSSAIETWCCEFFVFIFVRFPYVSKRAARYYAKAARYRRKRTECLDPTKLAGDCQVTISPCGTGRRFRTLQPLTASLVPNQTAWSCTRSD